MRGSAAWALRVRSLHGFPLSPLRSASAATPCEVMAALCAASMQRIVANSRRRTATWRGHGENKIGDGDSLRWVGVIWLTSWIEIWWGLHRFYSIIFFSALSPPPPPALTPPLSVQNTNA